MIFHCPKYFSLCLQGSCLNPVLSVGIKPLYPVNSGNLRCQHLYFKMGNRGMWLVNHEYTEVWYWTGDSFQTPHPSNYKYSYVISVNYVWTQSYDDFCTSICTVFLCWDDKQGPVCLLYFIQTSSTFRFLPFKPPFLCVVLKWRGNEDLSENPVTLSCYGCRDPVEIRIGHRFPLSNGRLLGSPSIGGNQVRLGGFLRFPYIPFSYKIIFCVSSSSTFGASGIVE